MGQAARVLTYRTALIAFCFVGEAPLSGVSLPCLSPLHDDPRQSGVISPGEQASSQLSRLIARPFQIACT